MKATSFKVISSKKYTKYHLTDHAKDSITKRFPNLKQDKYLSRTISIMIFNGKFIKDLEKDRKIYSYNGLWIVVDTKYKMIITLYERFSEI